LDTGFNRILEIDDRRSGARSSHIILIATNSARITDQGAAMRYKIVLEESDEGFAVSVPALPGCHSQGETEQEALENIADAIREYLAAINDRLRRANVREVEIEV